MGARLSSQIWSKDLSWGPVSRPETRELSIANRQVISVSVHAVAEKPRKELTPIPASMPGFGVYVRVIDTQRI